jgi:hypothetical protein
MHHTGSQENEVVAQPEEPEVVVQEATEEEEQEEELQECPDHHPSSFEKGKSRIILSLPLIMLTKYYSYVI